MANKKNLDDMCDKMMEAVDCNLDMLNSCSLNTEERLELANATKLMIESSQLLTAMNLLTDKMKDYM